MPLVVKVVDWFGQCVSGQSTGSEGYVVDRFGFEYPDSRRVGAFGQALVDRFGPIYFWPVDRFADRQQECWHVSRVSILGVWLMMMVGVIP